MGRLSDAAVALRDAVRLDPDRAEYWNALGTVLGASGQMAEAETAFGEAATRDVNNALYIYNHSLALEQLKRRDEAMEQLRRAAALGYPPGARAHGAPAITEIAEARRVSTLHTAT